MTTVSLAEARALLSGFLVAQQEADAPTRAACLAPFLAHGKVVWEEPQAGRHEGTSMELCAMVPPWCSRGGSRVIKLQVGSPDDQRVVNGRGGFVCCMVQLQMLLGAQTEGEGLSSLMSTHIALQLRVNAEKRIVYIREHWSDDTLATMMGEPSLKPAHKVISIPERKQLAARLKAHTERLFSEEDPSILMPFLDADRLRYVCYKFMPVLLYSFLS